MIRGKLTSVSTLPIGSEVIEVGDGWVRVFDAAKFEESGGVLLAGAVELTYTSADPEADIIELVGTDGLAPGDQLQIVPPKLVTEAVVRVDDHGAEPVVAIVPRDSNLSLTDGVRDNPDMQETVLLRWDGSTLVVDSIVGVPPVVNAPIGVVSTDGTQSGLSMAGNYTGARISLSSGVDIRGSDLLGGLGGGPVQGWLDLLPRGLIPGGYRETDLQASDKNADTEAAYLKLAVTLEANRRYRVRGRLRAQLRATDGVLRTRLRMTKGSSEPTTSSEQRDIATTGKVYTANIQMDSTVEDIFTPSESSQYRFVLTYQGLNGSKSAGRYARIYVEDIGPATIQVGGTEDGSTRVLYQSTWTATATRLYHPSGVAASGRDGDLAQSYWRSGPEEFTSPAFVCGGGAASSDNAAEVGKTMPGALDGATIHKAEVYIRCKQWVNTSRAILTFSTLGGGALPVSKLIDGNVWGGYLNSGEGAWFTLPVSWFTNGDNRGVCIGDKEGRTNDALGRGLDLESGYFHSIDDTNPPLLRFTYSRG